MNNKNPYDGAPISAVALERETQDRLNKKKITIYVRAQVEPKILDADMLVDINRYIEGKKRVRDLKIEDDFCYNGAWYQVRKIVL